MSAILHLILSALLWCCTSAHGQPPQSLPKTINDILVQLKSVKPDETALAEAAALASSAPPSTADRPVLVNYYFKRSHANRTLGLVAPMLDDARKAAELAMGIGGALEGDALVELSDAELWGGNYLNARTARVQQSKMHSISQSHAGFAMVAIMSANVGDLDSAEIALRASEQTLARLRSEKSWFAWESGYKATFERAKATVLRAKGKYREAEAAQRESIADTDISIEVNPRLQYANQVFLEARREELDVELAYLLIAQGRLQEAEWHARTVLQRTMKRVSNASPEIVYRLAPLAEILYLEGRFSESSALTSIASTMLAQSTAQPTTRAASALLAAEGRALVALGQYNDALSRYNQIRANLMSDPTLLQIYGRGDPDWALALIESGKIAEATGMLRMLLQSTLQWMGVEHPETGIVQGELGMALAAQGDRAAALAQFQPAMKLLLDPRSLNVAPSATLGRIALIVEAYIGLLADLQTIGEKGPGGIDPVGEAFQLADAIRGRSVQGAVAASAARTAATTPILGELTRKEQDLQREATQLYDALNLQLASPSDQQLPEVVTTIHSRLLAIGEEQRRNAATIQKDFPAYSNLLQPKPATIEQTRKALKTGEALLSILVTPIASYIWAIPQSGPVAFAVSKLTGAEVNALVGSIRKSLDPDTISIDQMPPLDTAAGYRLFSEFLVPVEAGWRDAKSLLVVSNGALTQLPLALLPTQPVTLVPDGQLPFTEFRSVPWLVKRVAITQLPSVNSFVTLRALAAPAIERSPFIGFGDPQFSRSQGVVAESNRGVHLRNLSISHPPQEGTESQFSAGRIVRSDPATADWIQYERLTPLPDTREEVLAIAQALKADIQTDVYFGTDASTRKVKSLDLSRRRVIVFATHGLLPGDLPNLTQPALALAAPIDPNESGLLTLNDILDLKLNADWVVLSACNMAAGDGAGADAISGLGRGFFYAGSRALLVTHWPVETVSARKLVTGVFTRIAADPSPSRAEALRQSMLALMEENAVDTATSRARFAYAHPIFWAPYAIFGDPGN